MACCAGCSLPNPQFFVGLFLLVATVSFPYVPLYPSWVLLQERSFQPMAGEKQTLGLGLHFPIPAPVNKGKHWISGALHAWWFSGVCENCRDSSWGLIWKLGEHRKQKRVRRRGSSSQDDFISDNMFLNISWRLGSLSYLVLVCQDFHSSCINQCVCSWLLYCFSWRSNSWKKLDLLPLKCPKHIFILCYVFWNPVLYFWPLGHYLCSSCNLVFKLFFLLVQNRICCQALLREYFISKSSVLQTSVRLHKPSKCSGEFMCSPPFY